jgi:CHAD domain-containing protein
MFTLAGVRDTAPQDIGTDLLQQAASDAARRAHEQAAAAVGSARHTRLMLTLARWLHGAQWRESLTQRQRRRLSSRLENTARKLLFRARRKLRRRGKYLRVADADSRHRLRIAAKKARYAAEFFRSLHPCRQLERYIDALAALQDELARRNDAATEDRLLQRLQQPGDGAAVAAAFTRGYTTSRTAANERRLRKLWKRVGRTRLPRRRGA